MTSTGGPFEPAWLLSLKPYRETSLLLEAFVENHGRVGLVARGARGPKSKLRGLLQPFRPLLLSWKDTGDLGALNTAEADGSPLALSGERVFHGWYVNELLLKLLQRHDPHPALYPVYVDTLAALAGDDGEIALRLFEKRLLAELGYALPLHAAIDAGQRYRFDPEAGVRETGSDDAEGIDGRSLLALRDERFDGDRGPLREARKILRLALDRQLGGRELETPRLLRSMRAQAAGASPGSPRTASNGEPSSEPGAS